VKVTAQELVKSYIFDNTLSEEEKASVKFELYIENEYGEQKANSLLNYDDFMEWISMYGIEQSSILAAKVECGFPVEVPEGTVRFIRVSPDNIEYK
jgi:hypothetical protein